MSLNGHRQPTVIQPCRDLPGHHAPRLVSLTGVEPACHGFGNRCSSFELQGQVGVALFRAFLTTGEPGSPRPTCATPYSAHMSTGHASRFAAADSQKEVFLSNARS